MTDTTRAKEVSDEELDSLLEWLAAMKDERTMRAIRSLRAQVAERDAEIELLVPVCVPLSDHDDDAEVRMPSKAYKVLRKDAERYRWLAADGDRAKALLNTESGLMVAAVIDAGIARLPYPFCRTPTRCSGTGSCQNDPCCAD